MDVLTKTEEERLLREINQEEVIEKEVAFSWDGKNLIVRFPKEIADYLKVNKNNRFKKNLKFLVREKEGIIKKEFEVVERKNGKRKKKKN